MLEVDQLTVGYGRVEIVQDVSFRVDQGEIVTILGANGAGKTTILKSLCGLVPPRQGRIVFKGSDIRGLPAHQVADLGIVMIPEGRQLFAQLSVRDNLKLGAYRPEARGAWQQSIDEVYALFPRLKEREQQAAGSLSGGEQQMVAIGRGLMAKPELLIFDEPSLGLSPLLVGQMFDVIRKIAERGVTVVIVEQNIFHTLSLADRGYILENGRIALDGTGRALLDDPRVKTAYLGH